MKTELLAWLINATVATSLVAGAIVLLRKPLQRWLGAEIAYRVWIALPLAALAACLSLPHRATFANTGRQAALASAPAVVVRVTSSLRSVDADRWLLAIWLLGACALFAALVWQQRRFVARLRLRQGGDGSWRSAVENATPAVLGVWRQKLVLPDCFETHYSETEQHLVIAHERMHQRRRDPWALAVCALLRTLFWFNPIVHVAATRFRRDVELACDAAVLRVHPHSRRRYADALLKTHCTGHHAPVGCHWLNTPPMKERIMLLKHASPARRARLAGAIVVGIATLASAGLAFAAHDAALSTASALAAAATPSASRQGYSVKLSMSVDGKPVANPTVLTRAGETSMVKVEANGVAWGFRFHVDPAQRGASALTGEVFSGEERHVIGHSHHEETNGSPMEIAIQEKPGSPRFVIHALIEPTSRTGPLTAMNLQDHQKARPGERREVRIVSGTPGDSYDVGYVDDESLPGDDAAPEQQREVREYRTCSRPDANGHTTCRVTRNVMARAPGGRGDVAPRPPVPPVPPTPRDPEGALAPLAPLPPPAPDSALAPMPPLPPIAPPANRMGAARPPAPPRPPLAMRAPPPPRMPPPNDLPAPPPPPAPPAPPDPDSTN